MEALQVTSPLAQYILRYEQENQLAFKPLPGFYNQVGINRIRFWQIVKGEKDPGVKEVKQLAKVLKVSECMLM